MCFALLIEHLGPSETCLCESNYNLQRKWKRTGGKIGTYDRKGKVGGGLKSPEKGTFVIVKVLDEREGVFNYHEFAIWTEEKKVVKV